MTSVYGTPMIESYTPTLKFTRIYWDVHHAPLSIFIMDKKTSSYDPRSGMDEENVRSEEYIPTPLPLPLRVFFTVVQPVHTTDPAVSDRAR